MIDLHAAAIGRDDRDERGRVDVLLGVFRDDVVEHPRHVRARHAGRHTPAPGAAQLRAQGAGLSAVAAHVADHDGQRPVGRDGEIEEVAADAQTLFAGSEVGDRAQIRVSGALSRQQALLEQVIEVLDLLLCALSRQTSRRRECPARAISHGMPIHSSELTATTVYGTCRPNSERKAR